MATINSEAPVSSSWYAAGWLRTSNQLLIVLRVDSSGQVEPILGRVCDLSAEASTALLSWISVFFAGKFIVLHDFLPNRCWTGRGLCSSVRLFVSRGVIPSYAAPTTVVCGRVCPGMNSVSSRKVERFNMSTYVRLGFNVVGRRSSLKPIIDVGNPTSSYEKDHSIRTTWQMMTRRTLILAGHSPSSVSRMDSPGLSNDEPSWIV